MQDDREYKNIVDIQSIILKKFNNDYRILNLLGKANKEIGNLDKAIHFLKLSLKVNPNYYQSGCEGLKMNIQIYVPFHQNVIKVIN